jgi:hypothetical protein
VQHLKILTELPALRRPVLLAAFTGWNEDGEAASTAVEALRHGLRAQAFATVDAEDFFDFQLVRPHARFTEDGRREVHWPRTRLSWAQVPGSDRHLVLLDGPEPNLRWRTYAEVLSALAEQLRVEIAITVGALQVDAPHTRPVPLTASTPDPDLAADLGLPTSSYEGPTGITGVVHQMLGDRGIPAVSLWAGIPHYLAAAVYAPGALALGETLSRLLGCDLPLDELAHDAAGQADDIAEIISEDDELADYITELEARADEAAVDDRELPAAPATGDELAAELERYLRDRGQGPR